MTGCQDPGFAIYLHWPFCLKKCPYCDFNSHVREAIDQAAWRTALLAEIDHFAAGTGSRTVGSIFFGGGTPSLMAPETAGAVLDRIAARWKLAPDVEITLEANPTSVEADKFRGFRQAGINRVSLGVQSLDDRALGFLGRAHSAAGARAAIGIAARTFERYSFDLIYALPGQTPDAWAVELTAALSLAGDHLSVYQLTIEQGTQFHTIHARGDMVLPDEDCAAALYERTQQVLGAHGMPAYEVSNHARPGAESRHNLTYWRYGDYLGVGPGAHGRLTLDGRRYALKQKRAPESWLAAVGRDGHGTEERMELERDWAVAEMVMMGLRLAEGIPRERFQAIAGLPLEAALDMDSVTLCVEAGMLDLDEAGIAATPAGRLVLNEVVARIVRLPG